MAKFTPAQCANISRGKTRHGFSQTRLNGGRKAHRFYQIWAGMKKRCDNPRCAAYKDYGARGISYQISWVKFEEFLMDMAETYRDDLTLDRIDNNKNYTKDNCRWTTMLVQGNNTRRNRILDFRGVKKSLSEWCRELGLAMKTVHARLKAGWSVERALTQPIYRSERAFSQWPLSPLKH